MMGFTVVMARLGCSNPKTSHFQTLGLLTTFCSGSCCGDEAFEACLPLAALSSEVL